MDEWGTVGSEPASWLPDGPPLPWPPDGLTVPEDGRVSVPLLDLLAHAAPAYGGTWPGAWTQVVNHPGERAVVEKLVDEFQRYGRFTHPIWIETETNDGVTVAAVRNGMHRVMAVCADSHFNPDRAVMDCWVNPDPDALAASFEHPGQRWAQVSWTVPIPDGVEAEDLNDDVYSAARSLWTPDGHWFEISGGTSMEVTDGGLVVEAWYRLPVGDETAALKLVETTSMQALDRAGIWVSDVQTSVVDLDNEG